MNNMSGSGYYGQQAYIPPSYIAPASTSAENAEVFPLANPTTNKSNKKKRPLKISVAASTNKEPISSAKSLNSAKPKLEKRPRVSQSRIEPKAIPKSDEYSLVQPEQVSGKAGNVNIKPVKPLLVKPSTSAKEPSIPATPISVKKPIAAKKNNKSGKIIASKPGVLSPAIIPTTETEKKLNENNQINNHDKVLEKEEPDTCFKDMKIKLVSKSLGIGMGEKNEDQGESAIPDETEYHPDKSNSKGQFNEEKYRNIQKAFQVLREPESRKLYDDKLVNYEIMSTGILNEQVSVKNMELNQEEAFYSYACRCGGMYLVYEEDLADERELDYRVNIIVGCDMCSLNIRVVE
ncbi:hypothetical protein BB560_006972 [Smittium megazygosporum]|uniref:Diphthamide biosynthesis protein 4 n=1 Tax=Smittium megazygosporum TaxID=133381 RepID=A0A2T9XZV7_9FUNG|nr:hypothetical protein BB560_006972 [Smittium megazygosporum]